METNGSGQGGDLTVHHCVDTAKSFNRVTGTPSIDAFFQCPLMLFNFCAPSSRFPLPNFLPLYSMNGRRLNLYGNGFQCGSALAFFKTQAAARKMPPGWSRRTPEASRCATKATQKVSTGKMLPSGSCSRPLPVLCCAVLCCTVLC